MEIRIRLRRSSGGAANAVRTVRLWLASTSPLDRVLATLIALNACAFALYSSTFTFNHYWLRHSTSLELDYGVPSDPRQLLITQAVFDEPCDIGGLQDDCDSYDSEVVEQLRKTPLPRVAGELIKARSFASAYHLLKSMSIRGADAEVPQVVENPVFDAESLSRFAVSWYLRPASLYAVHGREQDATRLFRLYKETVRVLPRRGEWLSVAGVDATDLVVLSDLFCVSRDVVQRDECDLGLLKTVARVTERYGYGGAGSFREQVLSGLDGFHEEYESLPDVLKTSSLSEYLALWSDPDDQRLSSQPRGLTPAQTQAWHYAQGALLIRFARATPVAVACQEILSRASSAFEQALEERVPASYFDGPASRRLDDVREDGGAWCGSRD